MLASFDGGSLPLNKAGQPYISQYPPSGQATVTLERTGGMVAPPGFQGYNGMVYTTTDIPLEGKQAVYLAIRPANAARFSQVELPDLGMLSDSAK